MISMNLDKKMDWWRKAKFGMFIHFGLYSMNNKWIKKNFKKHLIRHRNYSEWIMNTKNIPDSKYNKLAAIFNPVKFDAQKWVKTAKNTGMKYIIITSKHHEGFSLFDSKLTEYTVMQTPFKRDVIKELALACKKESIKFGIYYSILDWHQSIKPATMARTKNFPKYEAFMIGQLKELITNYHPSILFSDGDWIPQWNRKRGRNLEEFCRKLDPKIIINNRIGKRSWLNYLPILQQLTPNSNFGDYETPEQFIPNNIPKRDWEVNMTMNDSWGYKKSDNNWKSSKTIIEYLKYIISHNGNFLLNVGPDGNGEIPRPCLKILIEIGQWVKTSGINYFK